MIILGIETSCDETGAAIIRNGTEILSNVVASSQNLHEKTGGIIPEAAAREQIKCILPVINAAVKQSTDQPIKQENKKGSMALSLNSFISSHVDAIAVTAGPGLIGSLLVGVETAKTIAYVTRKPIIPINHIFAHIYANFLQFVIPSEVEESSNFRNIEDPSTPPYLIGGSVGMTKKKQNSFNSVKFPAIALVASGGHTELFYMKDYRKIKWLGGTRDDAAGEAFDKTARLLNLGFPGGPAIAAEAAKFQNSKFKIRLPRPMIDSDDLNFSFSGLKTAVIREINKLKTFKKLSGDAIQQLAFEIQEAITDVLVHKTLQAARQYQAASILLGGGVAANRRLREKFKFQIENLKLKIDLFIPPPHLCTDNAASVASYAYYNFRPVPWKETQAAPDLEVEV